MNVLEIIGYIASVLVAVSLMMRSVLRLRVINLVGAIFFTIYGLLIRAFPVAAVNFFIVLIDLYFLYEIATDREYFKLLEVRLDAEYLSYFIDFYRKEIDRFQPGFQLNRTQDRLAFFVLRDTVPAGLVIGETMDSGTLRLDLDFVIPGYRDFKTGRYVYRDCADFFARRGIRKICSLPRVERQEAYLKRMGFLPEEVPGEKRRYCLEIDI